MEITRVIPQLSALAQPTRYRCVQLLTGLDSCTAGDLAAQLGVPANTMSSHLTILSHAGLVTSSRSGRHIAYRVDRDSIRSLLDELGMLALDEGRP